VTNTQVTLVQIDNYGPWTTTPRPRRETDLQTLQSRLYADLSQFVGVRDGYVFFTRFDNMVAVTNGLTRADHERIQETIRNRYPVTVSLSAATAASPADALVEATELLQDAGSAQDGDRTEILRGEFLSPGRQRPDDVQIAHFDVVDATGTYTDELDAFATFRRIEQGYAALMAHLHERHGGLAFFVGGDNVIAVCPTMAETDYAAVVSHVRDTTDIDLRVGVGRGRTASEAGMDAKQALETGRELDTRVECAFPAVGECATD